jgi:hypothetical protein
MKTAVQNDEFRNKTAAIRYVMDALAAVDSGKTESFDFISSQDVTGFCKAIGFEATWAGKTYDAIAPISSSLKVNVVPETEARIVLTILKDMIRQDMLKSRDGSPFDSTILNDFLPKSRKGFAGEATLGHVWEWQYALAVELEHGRTRGTNVTNNHPLLTGLIVMAHLSEDKLYYARLACMELEGELTNAVISKKSDKEIADYARRHQIARVYLGRRLEEKLTEDLEIPG